MNVASDTGMRSADINHSLRFAMTTVMGPVTVNEEKFTHGARASRCLASCLTHQH